MVQKKMTLEEALAAYAEAQACIKALEKEKDAAKKIIQAACAESPSGTVVAGEHSATLTECTRNSFDLKAFEADHPRLAPKYTKTTTYEMLKVK